MAGIGDLVARLAVDNAPFRKGLQQSTGHMKSFVQGISGLIKTGVVGGLGLATAGVFALNKQMGSLDRTAKVSRNSGLGAETVAALGFAAEQSGGSIEGANQVIRDFTKRVGEAQNGSQGAIDVFEQIGIGVDSLASMGADQRLDAVFDGLAGIEDPAQRSAAAMQIFGEQGSALNNLFEQGSEGLAAFKAEAKDLGLGFDSEELAQVEAANDAINRVKRGFSAMASTVAVEAAPAIESFFTWMTDTTKSFGGLGAIADTTFRFIGDTWKWLEDQISYGITATMAIGEFAFTNWQEIAELAFKSAGLAAVTFGNDVAYFFTDQLPGYLHWFADNWQDVFKTGFNFVSTGFTNVATNIQNAWTALWDYITGDSDSFEFDWTPLTEGFKNEIKSLPDIPPRAMTELEKAMQADVDSISKGLGKSFDEIVTSRLDTLAEMQREASKSVKPTLEGATAAGGGGAGGGGSDSPVASGSAQFAGVAQAGSADAFSMLVRAMGQGVSPEQKEQQKTNQKMDQLIGATKDNKISVQQIQGP